MSISKLLRKNKKFSNEEEAPDPADQASGALFF
jgi:hypothetical protein